MERRRGAELEAVLLDAAWAELMESGYAQLTMEAVAARAQTGKQVLYRRWRNRAELVIASMRHHAGSIVENVPDTGSLRGDVLGVLQQMADRFTQLGPDTIHGLMAEAPDLDPEVYSRMTGVMAAIVKRAAERGEIATADVPVVVLTAPTNLMRHEIFFSHSPVPSSTITALVDDVFLPLVGFSRGT
ncbi:TetR/AcrR family transcriptional regulator [Kribbella soli]|uniref:TetR/AcrR family transcriptional regulator n=1 Tax=Kribbella soli TaxID=1124743 RepID=A0A4R0HDM7_9ACTN|nr:TetR/AcrR family transcriptional regulator [Kribbella soli]TCC07400.1 TetR/AcrR family transcriptional regulator [Kribbella soli]